MKKGDFKVGRDLKVHRDGEFGSYVELIDETKGIILKSPNRTRYLIKVADDGSLTTEKVYDE